MGRKTIRLAAMGVSLLACMAAEQALAQATAAPAAPLAETPASEAPAADTIVVTGSRLARLRADATVPTLVTPASALERSGDVLLQESFKRSPAFAFTTPGASSPIGAQSGPFGSGQTFIDYLGLGSQRTLVLLDSRRSISSSSASVFGAGDPGSQVDLNTIPTLMVDRIETMSVGGAPIYGSDAIAGTVNIVLKDQFQGLKLDGEYGLSDHGDAAQYRLGVLAGTDFAGGRGSVVASFEYTQGDGLLASDREVTRDGPTYLPPVTGTSAFKNVYVPNMRISAFSEYGVPVAFPLTVPGLKVSGRSFDIRNAQGQTLGFNATGQLVPYDLGTASGSPLTSAGGDGYNAANATSLLTPLRRYVGMVKARYRLTDGITAHVGLSYANSRGTTLRTDPAYNSLAFGNLGTVNGYLAIPLSNPFLSAADRATIASSITAATGNPRPSVFYLGRASTDAVSGRATSTTELYRLVGSVDGSFALAGREWQWEVSSTYGRMVNTGEGRQLLEQNFQNALAGCTGASSPLASINPTCSAFNPFGQTNSQATLDYVSAAYTAKSKNTQWVATASARGSLFDLPGGPAGVVVGYEHRYEHSQFDPDAFLFGKVVSPDPTVARVSWGRSAPVDAVRGHFHTNEVFGELRLPFIEQVEVNAAGRYVDHSTAGGAFTWTTGARFRPVPDVALRGNFTRSIRSPAVTELFNPASQAFLTGNDPCDSRFLASGPNPAVRAANCAAAGVPTTLISNIVTTGVLGINSGNRALKNEVADSWTLGLVLTPSMVPGFALTVDWLDIRLKDAIISATARQVLEACYDSTSYPAPSACGQFTRNAAGQVTALRTGFINAASTRYSGLAVDASWRIGAPFLGQDGRITLDAQYQYTDRLETRIGDGAITHLAGAIGNSKHKATGTLAADTRSVGGWLRMQYIGPAEVDMDAAAGTYDLPHRDAVAFIDAGARFTVQDKFTLRLSVENVFDTKPPFPSPAGGGVIAYWQGVMGRYVKVGASAAF
ncbi:TonB-dependent receptor domain-containing protein [Novosphingobium bradum]|uniref:TonB-dependent receptor domain-containing protein n=1 Tax=Novosphingobium bradum TaxID=1737444 RepID=A0ABV7IKN4_9SPHN